jgi:hypothetical protein
MRTGLNTSVSALVVLAGVAALNTKRSHKDLVQAVVAEPGERYLLRRHQLTA